MAAFKYVLDEVFPVGHDYYTYLQSLIDVIILLLGIATLRKKSDITLILIFVIFSVFSSWLNRVPIILLVNGFRDYIAFLFYLPILRYFFTCKNSVKYRKSIDKQFKFFLIIQTFCITEQFIRYGANDHGGGSLGNWASGFISISIILLVFYFMSKDWDGHNYLRSLWRNRLYVFLLFPVFLNETKVSFVVIFAAFILLYPFNIKSVGKLFLAVPFFVIFMVGAYMIYISATGNTEDVASTDYISSYLTGGEDADQLIELSFEFADDVQEAVEEWHYVDLPRIIKVGLMPMTLTETGGGLLLGAGLGIFKGGTTLEITEFARDHQSILYGTRMMIHYIFLAFGFVGLIWFFFWMKRAISFKQRANPMAFKVKLMLIFIVILSFFYNEYLRYPIPCAIFYVMCLSSTLPMPKNEHIKKTVK